MRHRFVRAVVRNILKARLSIILPFIVLLIDADIFYYSLIRKEKTVIIASSFVFLLSLMEIIAVSREVVKYINKSRKNEEIRKRIIKIVENMENPTVKKVVNKFIETNDEYSVQEIYPVVCKIMDELKD